MKVEAHGAVGKGGKGAAGKPMPQLGMPGIARRYVTEEEKPAKKKGKDAARRR